MIVTLQYTTEDYIISKTALPSNINNEWHNCWIKSCDKVRYIFIIVAGVMVGLFHNQYNAKY